jgi:hypothetical protein
MRSLAVHLGEDFSGQLEAERVGLVAGPAGMLVRLGL